MLTPLNWVLWQDPAYRADYEALVAEIRRQDAGLMTIKTVSRRNWPAGGGGRYTTCYEPFDDQEQISAAVSWVLAHEEVTGIATAGDVGLLGALIAAEAARTPVEEAEELLRRAADYSSPFVAVPF